MNNELTDAIQWKQIFINDHPVPYMISEYGNVFSFVTNKMIKQSKLHHSERIKVGLYINGNKYTYRIHRLVYETFKGPIPKDMTVDHIDENIYNNHISNLRLLTREENAKSYFSNHQGERLSYPNETTIKYFKLLKSGIFYMKAAKELNIRLYYAENLLYGRRQKELWKQYMPFPESAYRKLEFTESDKFIAIKAIIDGYSNREILNMIHVKYSSASLKTMIEFRKELGFKTRKYFDSGFIEDIDRLILEGKPNNEIYDILSIDFDNKISWLMSRRRNYLNIPNNNCKVGTPEEIKLVKQLIIKGYSNDDILKKIGKERNQYYINLFGGLRYEMRQKGIIK